MCLAAVALLGEGRVAEDLLDRDSGLAEFPFLDREDVDHAILVHLGSLAPKDHEDPWDRDHAVLTLSAHGVRDCQLLSLPGRKVPLPQDLPGESAVVFVQALAAGAAAVPAQGLVLAQVPAVVVQELAFGPVVVPAQRVWVRPHQVSGLQLLLWRLERSRQQQWRPTRPPWQLH
jgi:hypothetical protein